MNKDGLEQAQARFMRINRAAGMIASSAPVKEREAAWLDIIAAFGTLYSKLEQASKATPEATRWFREKKETRKQDPLLQYMHHARNADEHTLVRVATGAQFAVKAVVAEGGGTLGVAYDAAGRPFMVSEGMANPKLYENEVMLHTAIDRGVSYQPPTMHMGQHIADTTARAIAPLIVAYAERLLQDASGFLVVDEP